MEAIYRTSVFPLGNSHAVRLPKDLMDAVSFRNHEKIMIQATESGEILIQKEPSVSYPSIAERFAGYSGDYQPSEWDTGQSGREIL